MGYIDRPLPFMAGYIKCQVGEYSVNIYVLPSSRRDGGDDSPTWRAFLRAQAATILATGVEGGGGVCAHAVPEAVMPMPSPRTW